MNALKLREFMQGFKKWAWVILPSMAIYFTFLFMKMAHYEMSNNFKMLLLGLGSYTALVFKLADVLEARKRDGLRTAILAMAGFSFIGLALYVTTHGWILVP